MMMCGCCCCDFDALSWGAFQLERVMQGKLLRTTRCTVGIVLKGFQGILEKFPLERLVDYWYELS